MDCIGLVLLRTWKGSFCGSSKLRENVQLILDKSKYLSLLWETPFSFIIFNMVTYQAWIFSDMFHFLRQFLPVSLNVWIWYYFFPRKNSQCYIFREWKRSIIKDLGVSKLPCVIKFLLFDKSFHGLFISLARLSTLKQIQKSGLISHAQTYPREFSNATTKNFF